MRGPLALRVPLVSLQPSASKSSLLVGDPDPKTGLSPGGCARPFSKDTDTPHEEPGYAAKYGSALHELLYLGLGGGLSKSLAGDIAVKWGLDFDSYNELLPHAVRAVDALTHWMNSHNPWGATYRIVGAEKHLAFRPRYHGDLGYATVETRETDFDEKEHRYELASREIGGTYDLLLQAVGHPEPKTPFTIVLDYKTGSGFYDDYMRPSRLPQMRTLALATGASAVAVLHTPRDAPSVVYAEEIPQAILDHHARLLRQAMRRIGDGSMRPDGYCKYCPARAGCPAFDGELLKSAGALVKTVVAHPLAENVDPGEFHMFLTEMERLTKRGREALKARVAQGEIIMRPDGKVLVMRPRAGYESASKSGFERQLGKAAAEKLMTKLRKMGALEQVEASEAMVAVKDENE